MTDITTITIKKCLHNKLRKAAVNKDEKIGEFVSRNLEIILQLGIYHIDDKDFNELIKIKEENNVPDIISYLLSLKR